MKAFLNRATRLFGACLAPMAAVLAFLITLSGCSRGNVIAGKDTLVVIESADASTLNPFYAADFYSGTAISLIFDPLAQFDSNYHLVPWLATSWKHSPDGLHWEIHLRKGVTWSDGVPFTSRDVVWTWQTTLNPATGDPYFGQYTFIKQVHAEGPYSVRFDLKTPNALFLLDVLGGVVLPEHVLGKYPASAQRGTDFAEHPIGTGPYILSQWQHDEKMVLVRNPHWWHGLPKIPKIMLRMVFVDEATAEAMRQGDAQVAQVSPQTVDELRGDPNIRIVTSPSLYVGITQPNERRPGLNDNHVLQAMMYGWDRAQLARGLDRGNSQVGTGIVPPELTYWYDPHVRLYPYDPVRARAILERDGWHLGPDGIRSRRGVRLAFSYYILGRDGASEDQAAEFQADMQDIGIGISVQSLDWPTFLQKGTSGDFDLLSEGWGGIPDPDEYTSLDSSQFTPTGNNLMHYSDPEVDRDLREGLMHTDPRQRKVYYDDFQRRIAEHLPFLFAEFNYDRYAFSRRVHIDLHSILTDDIFYNIGDWSLSP